MRFGKLESPSFVGAVPRRCRAPWLAHSRVFEEKSTRLAFDCSQGAQRARKQRLKVVKRNTPEVLTYIGPQRPSLLAEKRASKCAAELRFNESLASNLRTASLGEEFETEFDFGANLQAHGASRVSEPWGHPPAGVAASAEPASADYGGGMTLKIFSRN